jgi:hypothetical protein
VVLAFASLGGSDAEAVYCTSWAEQQTEFWLVRAVDGDFLVYVPADGRSLWRGDEDRPAESLEAFAAPVRSYVSAVGIEETEVRGGDYGFGERRRPIAPWHPLWVLTKNRNSAAGAHQQCHLTCSFLDSRAHHTAPLSRAVTSRVDSGDHRQRYLRLSGYRAAISTWQPSLIYVPAIVARSSA